MSGQKDRSQKVHISNKGNVAAVDADGHLQVDVISGAASAAVSSTWISLSEMNMTFNSTNASTTTTRHDVSGYRRFAISGNWEITGTPTDIRVEVRAATNSTTSTVHHLSYDWWGDVRWDDTAANAEGRFYLAGWIEAPWLEVYATWRGAAGNLFTGSQMTLYLKD